MNRNPLESSPFPWKGFLLYLLIMFLLAGLANAVFPF